MLEPDTRLAEPQLRPKPPSWLLAVILVIVGLSIYGAVVGDTSIRHAGAKKIKVSETDLDDQSVQDLISVDLYMKAAFLTGLIDGKPDRKYLDSALASAVSLADETHNAPFAARRLILVRAVDGLPPLSKTRKGTVPLDAYAADVTAGYSASDRAAYVDEARLWQGAFMPAKLTAAETVALARQAERQPNLKWWRGPALYAIYTRGGNASAASKALSDAANDCVTSVAAAGALLLLKILMILAGIGLLVALAVIAFERRQREAALLEVPEGWGVGQLSAYGQPGTPAIRGMPARSGFELWKTVPDQIADGDRRLSSADLYGVFLLYLVLSTELGMLTAGFPGFGHAHILKFAGFIAPFQHRISLMGSSQRMVVLVGLECFLYIAGGGIPILWLIFLARRRGASLSRELGLTRKLTLQSILYGAGGYCIGLPLMLAVALVAPQVFRHFPSPSNPAIPQLISANTALAGILLTVLASFVAPIVEETLFRGVLFNAIKVQLGVWPGIILSAFVFGFIHPVGIAEMFPLAVLGGVFAWMAQTRKSLAPSMVAHCINNLTSCLLVISLMQQ